MLISQYFHNFARLTLNLIPMRRISILAAIAAAMLSCTSVNDNSINVVPYPNEVEVKAGTFDAAGAEFHLSEGLDEGTVNIIKAFAAQLSLASGKECTTDNNGSRDGFIFTLNPDMPVEAYSLKVSRKAVEVEAATLRGFNYAIQTIKQMLPAEIFGKEEAAGLNWTLPCVEINDEPRFSYRGMHMDVVRHFFDMNMVKRYLDIMEVHKLNTLHWHITDDQGWRIEIKKYPKLTEIGSIRKETIIGHIFESDEYDGTPYGEGCWFSQEQIREIIDYAAAKGIEIIPEIDLPGHMLAALAAYPHLGCTGGPYDVWGRWGVADEVLCAGNEETMTFLENVLAEVAELFPSEYVHIGGDECPKVYWEKCPKCQAKIKELGLQDTDEFQAEHYLQSYVMKRMTNFLESKGKKVIGWDEILEGEVAENATVMSWRGTAGGVKAARMGHDVIMTPNTFFYLDYYQSLDKENEPLAIGGYIPVEKCYSYEPMADGMTEEEMKHILGVQANLWTEYIASDDHLEYMLLPRMAALSEVQWCQPENKSWERFLDSADDFCAIYDVMGYSYGKHIFDTRGQVSINKDKGCVEVTLEAQGDTPVRYTLDGSDPCEDSPVYTAPIEIRESCTLKARSERNGTLGKIYEKSFTAHKAMGRPVKALTETHHNYTYNCPDMLTDGLRGAGPYNSGDFAGWHNKPFEAVIEMDGDSYSSVTLSTIAFRHDWIFGPMDMTIYISEDGESFTQVAHADYTVTGLIDDGNVCEAYTLNFPETSAKFLKVTASCIKSLPDWHPGKGSPGFLFVDEVIVL